MYKEKYFQAAEQLQATSYSPGHALLSCCFVVKYGKQDNRTEDPYDCTSVHQITSSLPRMNLFKSTKWATSYELLSRRSVYTVHIVAKSFAFEAHTCKSRGTHQVSFVDSFKCSISFASESTCKEEKFHTQTVHKQYSVHAVLSSVLH